MSSRSSNIKNNQNMLHKIVPSIHIEFHPKDVLQIIIGSSILAIPVGFTEETWKLGESLPMANIIALSLLSIMFISAFVYHNYYHHKIRGHLDEFFKRVISTYLISFAVVALLLTIIQKTPWTAEFLLSLKRTIIISFPASMSGTIADVIK